MSRRKQNNLQLVAPTLATVIQERSSKCKVTQNDLKTISPLTENQRKFFELFDKQASAVLLHGVAGTGKTFIALYKALEEVLEGSNKFERVIIVRSAVPSREIGHLPGDEKEKTEVYTLPYVEICEDLFNHIQPFVRLQEQKVIHFLITSFVRGITLDNSIVIVDECQNMTDMELNSVMTRIGKNSKVIFCGDFRQTDLYKKSDMSGLQKFLAITYIMPSFNTIEFNVNDIVRSKLVKEYIVARLEYESRHAA